MGLLLYSTGNDLAQLTWAGLVELAGSKFSFYWDSKNWCSNPPAFLQKSQNASDSWPELVKFHKICTSADKWAEFWGASIKLPDNVDICDLNHRFQYILMQSTVAIQISLNIRNSLRCHLMFKEKNHMTYFISPCIIYTNERELSFQSLDSVGL